MLVLSGPELPIPMSTPKGTPATGAGLSGRSLIETSTSALPASLRAEIVREAVALAETERTTAATTSWTTSAHRARRPRDLLLREALSRSRLARVSPIPVLPRQRARSVCAPYPRVARKHAAKGICRPDGDLPPVGGESMKVDARCQRVLTRGAAFAGPAARVPPASSSRSSIRSFAARSGSSPRTSSMKRSVYSRRTPLESPHASGRGDRRCTEFGVG